jgi:hypothetical protein
VTARITNAYVEFHQFRFYYELECRTLEVHLLEYREHGLPTEVQPAPDVDIGAINVNAADVREAVFLDVERVAAVKHQQRFSV